MDLFSLFLIKPFYVSPDVILGNYSEKCDIWSVGVILYVMLKGNPPYQGKNEKELLQKIVNEEISFNEYYWNDISPEAKYFMKLLMTHDPNKRISASEAIQNPWITSLAPSHHINSSIIQSIGEMHENLKMKNAILAFISSQVFTQFI